MKLWEKKISTSEIVEKFTVGNDQELDFLLAKYDVLGSKAHITMLQEQGFISKEELDKLLVELDNILATVESNEFTIEEGIEDVHSQVEFLLTQKLGDAGKKIHTGRSRNDQVLVDLMLLMKHEIDEICQEIYQLFEQLLILSENHKNELMPGYTHMQIAMPSSFGMWFAAHAETLIDDVYIFEGAYKVVNQNPLGSAAGFGSAFPLNRKRTTELLQFKDLKYNSIAAQLSRGKAEKVVAFAMSSCAGTLNKLAMDICLYMGQNYGFFSFPDELTTGSSIMPHKKNPDVFELIRARCNQLQALPTELTLITSNLPTGYHRDFQQIKERFLPAIQTLKSLLEMTTFMLKHIRVNTHCMEDARYDYLYTVEEVNKLVIEGVPFRDAYKKVAEMIENGTYMPNKNVEHTHEGSIGNLCNDKIKIKMQQAMSFL